MQIELSDGVDLVTCDTDDIMSFSYYGDEEGLHSFTVVMRKGTRALRSPVPGLTQKARKQRVYEQFLDEFTDEGLASYKALQKKLVGEDRAEIVQLYSY